MTVMEDTFTGLGRGAMHATAVLGVVSSVASVIVVHGAHTFVARHVSDPPPQSPVSR